MKKILNLLIVVLFLALISQLSSCKKDDSTKNGIKISEKAKVINETIWNQHLISIDTFTYKLTFTRNAELENLKIGDFLISSVDEGLLRKVKSIQVVNDQIIMLTEDATLTDVIMEGVIDFEQQLNMSQIKSIDYHIDGIYLDTINLKSDSEIFSWNINTILYDEDNNLQTTFDQIRLLGTFDCDWKFIAKIDIGLTQGLKEVKFGFESEESLDLQLLAGLQYDFETNFTLATINFAPIIVVVGFLPVVFVPQLKIILGVDGYANASITTAITQSLEFETGLQYLKNSGWSSYKNFDRSFSFQPPQLNMNTGAIGYIKPEMAIKLYGITGPYANLKLYGKIDANLMQNPWWRMYAGINMGAGVKATILDKFVLDFIISDLINVEQQIGQATTLPILIPTAAFTAIPTSGTASLNVNFTDQSTNNPTSWAWDFGDGGNSTQQNPSHIYQNAGSYTVQLIATNSHGSDTETKNNYIQVSQAGDAPVAAFTANPTSGTAPLNVNFTDQSTNNPTSWQWNFGDGGNSTQQNPSHTYQNAGSYTVQLIATNSLGSDTETKNNYITVTSGGGSDAPVAAFTGNPTSGTAPLTVSFTDQSTNNPTIWQWDFGDGTTSTQQNPSKTFSAPGNYTVKLTSSNSYGSDTHVKNNYINVLPVGGGHLLDGLSLYWDFDQSTNSSFQDKISNALLTMNAGASLSENGILDQCVLNNGANGSGLLFGNYNMFTIKALSFWVKPITLQENQYLMHGKIPASNHTVINYKRNGNNIYLQTQIGNSGYYLGTNISLTIGVWNHVIVTENQNSLVVYLNGEIVATANGINTMIDDKLTFLLRHQTNGHEVNARFDEFGVWNRPLEHSEIIKLYNNGAGLKYPFN